MNITEFLRNRSFWQHGAPTGPEKQLFEESLVVGRGLKDGSVKGGLDKDYTLEVKSFAPGVYVSNHMAGTDAKPLSLRASGYFLTEHILSHAGRKEGGTTRLDDLQVWGSEDKHLKQLNAGSEPYHLSPNKPSQFEWLLWQTIAASQDVADPKLSLATKQAELKRLQVEVARVSDIWSARKSQTKSGGENVLSQADIKAKNSTKKYLDNMFASLAVPANERFYLQYNPQTSIQAGIAFDEAYQKPSDLYVEEKDPFFADEEDVETEAPSAVLTAERQDMVRQCLTSFFLFENGNAIISEIRSAKSQLGLRTVEPGVVLNLPDTFANQLPSKLAYVRSIDGVPDPDTGKSEKAYKYATVDEKGNVLPGVENEITVSAALHKAIRLATAPLLKMVVAPGIPAVARYVESKRFGKHPAVKFEYVYMDENNKKFTLDAEQHKNVLALNPEHVSDNVRGKIDHLFTRFFVDEVKPHYRMYLPETRMERIVLAEQVKETLSQDVGAAWKEINEKGGSLEQRTERAQAHYAEWLKKSLSPQMSEAAPTLFKQMKSEQAVQIDELVSKRAREAALIGYMEEIKGGENIAPNYGTYGLRGKFKTWRTQILAEGGAKLLNDRISQATAWAEEHLGGLKGLVPASHTADKLEEFFNKEVGVELRNMLTNRGVPQTKGLVSLTNYVNPMSIVIFYDRRMQHLDWNYAFDTDLPEMNLSKLAKEGKKPVVAKTDDYWQDVEKRTGFSRASGAPDMT